MKSKLSGLMDGEVAEHEVQGTLSALRQDPELRRCWQEYQMIGDTLKGESRLDVELTGRVMAALEAEPTVLAPVASRRKETLHRNLLALAATLAGVAVVGWLALGSNQSPQVETVAQAGAPAATIAKAEQAARGAAAVPVAQVRPAPSDMQEYLIAHETQSSLLEFRGGAEHFRTVAAVGTAPAK
jgi:sigma-E factor negative regulatory protein RseA